MLGWWGGGVVMGEERRGEEQGGENRYTKKENADRKNIIEKIGERR